MAFEFFKNQFEIDELKYQGIVERNRNNGRKGGNDKNKQSYSVAKKCSEKNRNGTKRNKINTKTRKLYHQNGTRSVPTLVAAA